jgi:hypothetical protein
MNWKSLRRGMIVLMLLMALAIAFMWGVAFPSIVEPPHGQATSPSNRAFRA